MPDYVDISPMVRAALETVQNAKIGAGNYRRWLDDKAEMLNEDDAPNPYGCADAANILYTLGAFPRDLRERKYSVSVLQSMQNPETGLFHEKTHHPYHVTAHCVAALELFDSAPLHPLSALTFLDQPGALETFLESLEWETSPWNASHQGAAIYAARVICAEATSDWQERYFAWLAREQEPKTGFWRKGFAITGGQKPLFDHLAGSFHYLFNHEYAKRPLCYPEQMIDSCLDIFRNNLRPSLGRSVSFSEIDWIYCLTRSSRQCGHRYVEVKGALKSFANIYCDFLSELVATHKTPFKDLHALLGTLCALAELQAALPGVIRSEHPLRLVLDRRPFI